jgi:type I restriction enzyme S subunit
MYGATIGQLAIAGIPLTTNQACCACSPYKGVGNLYLFYFLMANKSELIKLGNGGAQPNISRKILIDFLLPLPPLAEQARIVKKMEELQKELEEMDASRTDMKKRCDLTRKMILQQAIKGALVPQQTSEGTAQDLVDNIREEKAVLVSEKKLKKDPKESYIYRDEEGHFMERIGKQEPVCIDNDLPFAVPEGWTWARLGEINTYESQLINPNLFPDDIYELYSVPTFNTGEPEYVKGKSVGSSKQSVQKNDVLISKINPHINRVWKVFKKSSYINVASSEWIVFRNSRVDSDYLRLYFSAPYFRTMLQSQVSGVGGSLMRAKPALAKKGSERRSFLLQ